MDDSEPNNNSTHIHVLQTKGEKHEGHTVQPRHETKPRQCPLLHDICHLSCNEHKLECYCTVKSWWTPTTQLIVVHRI
jgi:hypothetical protein